MYQTFQIYQIFQMKQILQIYQIYQARKSRIPAFDDINKDLILLMLIRHEPYV